MAIKEPGILPANKIPNPESKEPNQNSTNIYCSAKVSSSKPPSKTFSDNFDRAKVKNQLREYINLGLVPIPLRRKIPIVRWKDWNPYNLHKLSRYISPGVDWGIKTGINFAAIDFDTRKGFIDFIVSNIDELPESTPIVKSGRGYHIWFKPNKLIRNQQFDGIDIKGEGGYIVAPPSIHQNGTEYKFINRPNGFIPELDLDKLKFPRIRPERQEITRPTAASSDRRLVKSTWETEPGFDWDHLQSGVNEGQRHNTLVRLTGWLIGQDYTKDSIMALAIDWNSKNKPPLPGNELVATIDSCYKLWSKNVPTKTLIKSASVLIGTKNNYDSSDIRIAELEDNSKISEWETEIEHNPHYYCGRKRRIVRSGRKYASVSFFCGRWDCPRCSAYFKQRWIDHITSVTRRQTIYALECDEAAWPRLRRRMNRCKADYIRIRCDESLRVITNKALKGFTSLPADMLREFLGTFIPTTADACPISTSRSWEREKNTKHDTEYKYVTNSWLPLYEQTEIAKDLGAAFDDFCHWLSPEDVDEEEWEDRLIVAVRNRERELEKVGEFVGEYLDKCYAMDDIIEVVGLKRFRDMYLMEMV